MASLIFKKSNQDPKEHQTENNNSVYRLEDPTFCYEEISFPIARKIMLAIESGLEVLNLEQEWYYPEASRSNAFWYNPEVVQYALSHWGVLSDAPAKSLGQGRRAN